MPRWVDLRLANTDAGRAMTLLASALGPVNMSLNTNPPSAAPGVEFELSVEGHSQYELELLLAERGVSVLAARERL